MPYIRDENNRRQELRTIAIAKNAGELNYQIFSYIKNNQLNYSIRAIVCYVDDFLGAVPNYQKYNDMTGCLIRCHKEIKRRLNINLKTEFIDIMESYDDEIAMYENDKILENGDV